MLSGTLNELSAEFVGVRGILGISRFREAVGYFQLHARTPHCILLHFLSTHFFPCLNPIFTNGSFLSVVAV